MLKKQKLKTATESFNDAQKLLNKYIGILKDGWSPRFPTKIRRKTGIKVSSKHNSCS